VAAPAHLQLQRHSTSCDPRKNQSPSLSKAKHGGRVVAQTDTCVASMVTNYTRCGASSTLYIFTGEQHYKLPEQCVLNCRHLLCRHTDLRSNSKGPGSTGHCEAWPLLLRSHCQSCRQQLWACSTFCLASALSPPPCKTMHCI